MFLLLQKVLLLTTPLSLHRAVEAEADIFLWTRN